MNECYIHMSECCVLCRGLKEKEAHEVCKAQREKKDQEETRVTKEIMGTLVHLVPKEHLAYQADLDQKATE